MVSTFIYYENKPYKIKIDSLKSIYSLKNELSKKFNLSKDEFNILYKNKVLDNNQTSKYYNIEENDILRIVNSKNGGKPLSKILILILGIFIFIFFIIFIFLGLLPIVSHFVSSIIIKAFIELDKLIQILDTNNIIKKFTNIPLFRFLFRCAKKIINFLSILIFGQVVAFLAVFFIYYFNRSFCDAFNRAWFVSKWTSLMYTVLYMFWDLPNIFFNTIERNASGEGINEIKGPLTSGFIKLWDRMKQLVLSIIPFAGPFYLTYLGGIEAGLIGFQAVEGRLEELINNFPNYINDIKNNTEFKSFVKENKLQDVFNMILYTYDLDNQQLKELRLKKDNNRVQTGGNKHNFSLNNPKINEGKQSFSKALRNLPKKLPGTVSTSLKAPFKTVEGKDPTGKILEGSLKSTRNILGSTLLKTKNVNPTNLKNQSLSGNSNMSLSLFQIRFSFVIRWIWDNLLSLFVVTLSIINGVCPNSRLDELEKRINNENDKINEKLNELKDIPSYNTELKESIKEAIKDLTLNIKALMKDKQDEIDTETINVECMFNYFENGCLSFFIPFIVFIILFIIKLF